MKTTAVRINVFITIDVLTRTPAARRTGVAERRDEDAPDTEHDTETLMPKLQQPPKTFQ